MLPLVPVLAALLIGAADSDAATLLGLMEAAQSPVRDIYLEYEGRMSFPTAGATERTDADGVYDEYSGVFIERQDGAFFVDIYHRYAVEKSAVSRETLSILGDRLEVYVRTEDSSRGGGRVEEAHVAKLKRVGSIPTVIQRPEVLARLGSPDWVAKLKGTEEVGGASCVSVEFAPSNNASHKYMYAIDLDRGGNVLKSEVLENGNIVVRMTVFRIDKFEDARKQPIWIPTQAVLEAFGGITEKDIDVYYKEATNRETFTVLPESIRVGTGFKDDRFSVKFRSGTPITDTLKQARYDFGRNGPLAGTLSNPADAQAVLEEQIQLAKAQGDELLASSRERSGDGWWGWAPWIVSLGSLSALILVVFHSRSGR